MYALHPYISLSTPCIQFILQYQIMQSSIVALVAFSMLLALVQCSHEKDMSEYEIKEGLLSGGRTYEIKGKTNAPLQFSTRNELLSVGKKLTLLEGGKERYTVKHDISNLMSTWTITNSASGKQLGTIQNKLKFVGSKIDANGEFGHYKIEGDFGNHSFTIKKDGHKVAQIEKKSFHIHDTYGLTVYGNADQALMVLFTIIVDEIRQH
jgi:uncharacterized protein YxjI